ncbi:MAG: hypothetical protein ACOY5F_13985 [Pseudomonadota bacterium]|jgi:hypothetical protein
MTTVKATGEAQESRRPDQELDRRYGKIAISALVAALPYGGESGKAARQSREPENPRKHRAA